MNRRVHEEKSPAEEFRAARVDMEINTFGAGMLLDDVERLNGAAWRLKMEVLLDLWRLDGEAGKSFEDFVRDRDRD